MRDGWLTAFVLVLSVAARWSCAKSASIGQRRRRGRSCVRLSRWALPRVFVRQEP